MIHDFCVVYHREKHGVEWKVGTPLVQQGCEAIASGRRASEDVLELYHRRFPQTAFLDTCFAAWDREARVLGCARDPSGIRNLFVRETPESIAFSTRIASLAPRQFDPEGLSGFLAGTPSPESTCFLGIRAVPRDVAIFVRDGELRILERAAFERQTAERLQAILEEAVRARRPDGPFACGLSGGIDSALLLALAGRQVRPYTLAPSKSSYSEVDAARATARHLDHDPRLVPIDDRSLVAALPECVAAVEAPIYNLHAVSRLLLARAVRDDGLNVLVGGEGADELFGESILPQPDLGLDPVVRDLFRLPTLARPVMESAFPILLLRMAEAVCSAEGIELRLPFLDPALEGISRSLTIEQRRDKRLLRELAASMLNDEIAARPKRPMLAPPVDLFSQYLDDDAIERCGVFKPKEVHELYARFRKSPNNTALDRALLRIVTTIMLYDRLIAPCAG